MDVPDTLAEGQYAIYALIDPTDQLVYYVGQTQYPKRRFAQHMLEQSRQGAKAEWLRGLIEKRQQPLMQILEIVGDEKIALAREREWIYRYIEQGMPLVNAEAQWEAIQQRRSEQAIIPLRLEIALFCGSPVTRAYLPDGHKVLVFNDLTHTLGITSHGQLRRIERDPFLRTHLFYIRLNTSTRGGPQIMLALAEEAIPYWAVGIQPQKRSLERRALLRTLKHKAVEILYQQSLHISDEQLVRLVEEMPGNDELSPEEMIEEGQRLLKIGQQRMQEKKQAVKKRIADLEKKVADIEQQLRSTSAADQPQRDNRPLSSEHMKVLHTFARALENQSGEPVSALFRQLAEVFDVTDVSAIPDAGWEHVLHWFWQHANAN
jgi:predicted GIY-YIG superfamily endonuclease